MTEHRIDTSSCPPKDQGDKTLMAEELDLLRRTVGKMLVSFEASPDGGHMYYERIKVLLEDLSLLVSNSLEIADIGYVRDEAPDEAGVLRVSETDGPLIFPDVVYGPENVIVPIGSKVTGVEVVNDHIRMLRDGEETNKLAFTQAIIFHLEEGDLVIDRDIWFEVFVNVYVTDDGRRSLRDTSKEWCVDDYPFVSEVEREFVTL